MRNAIVVITFLFLFSSIDTMSEETVPNEIQKNPIISGIVVDLNDNPIEDVSLAIMPMKQINGHLQPIEGGFWQHHFHGGLPIRRQLIPNNNDDINQIKFPVTIKTDTDGKFTTNKLPKGFVQLMIAPENPNSSISEKQIFTIQIGKITLFENGDDYGPNDKLSFMLDNDEVFENIKIKVKKLLKIKAQVVSKEGKPIKNVRIRLNMNVESENSHGSYGTSTITNDTGHFTYYRSETGIYTVTVEYQNFKGGVTPFQLDYETPAPENIVIKLDGNPVENDLQKLIKPGIGIGEQVHPNIDPIEIQELIRQQRQEQIAKQEEEKRKKEVWIINPTNGHAYKKIQCENWHDAQQTAIDELAHLVSITDVNEQLWLQTIFGQHPYWIGLNDIEEEGVWKWDSGEPVNYTNWNTQQFFGSTHTDDQKDYVAMTYHFGAWQSVAPDNDGGHSPLWRMTRHAIIEKDGLISKKINTDATDE